MSFAQFCHHSSAGPFPSPDPLPQCSNQLHSPSSGLISWPVGKELAPAPAPCFSRHRSFDLRRWMPMLRGLAALPSFPTSPGGAPGQLLSHSSSVQPALATAACPCVCRQDPPTRCRSNHIKGPRHRAAAVPPHSPAFKSFEERPG